ncbi:MAG: hypothetical protein MUC95_06830, partial [Spirochaetes bacterium]|nr:hypothetical protein [Spirochaetota bacterium]
MGKTAEIEHRITYSRQGTRSEAKHGHLFINGNEVPALFTIIISGKEVFRFHQRTWLWGIDGYFPVEKTENACTIKESSAQIGSDLLDKGWYAGKERLS